MLSNYTIFGEVLRTLSQAMTFRPLFSFLFPSSPVHRLSPNKGSGRRFKLSRTGLVYDTSTPDTNDVLIS
jgi:hypothetical protein